MGLWTPGFMVELSAHDTSKHEDGILIRQIMSVIKTTISMTDSKNRAYIATKKSATSWNIEFYKGGCTFEGNAIELIVYMTGLVKFYSRYNNSKIIRTIE